MKWIRDVRDDPDTEPPGVPFHVRRPAVASLLFAAIGQLGVRAAAGEIGGLSSPP